ncbi:hypothetical protein [Sphingomonas sp. NPDC079357]|uniref:hypothetical protein n=1 Tax=Sphingomonas sp. NPDC079357 TaxID=3364518 RepID=UPI00384CB139
MNEIERGRGPANVAAHQNEDPEILEEAGRVQLNADGSVTMEALDELSTWVLGIAATCGSEVAEKARYVRQLRAAKGGTSNTSQTAGRFLAHPRLKSVTLTNDHRALLERVAKAQEALRPLMVAAISKMLELELHLADLRRCEDAIEGKRLRDMEQSYTCIWPEARSVVSRLGRAGVREGHWSTVTRATEDQIAQLILTDNLLAGVGSPDDPQMTVDGESDL